MSRYTKQALEMRRPTPDGRPSHSCCQSVAAVFAEDAGYDRKAALKAATYFRGGMQMGSVCGALTGGLMVLGLAGVTDHAAANTLIGRFRDEHGDMTDCRDLLADNAAKGGEKAPFCNRLICGCVDCVEEILKEYGVLTD